MSPRAKELSYGSGKQELYGSRDVAGHSRVFAVVVGLASRVLFAACLLLAEVFGLPFWYILA